MPERREYERCADDREEAGSLMVGAFEPDAVPWGQRGIPDDFSFEERAGHMEEQLMRGLEHAM